MGGREKEKPLGRVRPLGKRNDQFQMNYKLSWCAFLNITQRARKQHQVTVNKTIYLGTI